MDTKQDEQNVHILQRVVEELKKETNNFYVFLQGEGGKDLVKKYKVTHHVALLSFVHLLTCPLHHAPQEWRIVQTLRADEESLFSIFSPELIVLIFSHLDECSLATASEVPFSAVTTQHNTSHHINLIFPLASHRCARPGR